MSLSIGQLELGNIPRVAAIIDKELPLSEITPLAQKGADLLEIRVDLIEMDFDQVISYIRGIKEKAGLPLIGTIRETKANSSQRLTMFEQVIPLVDCIDIEIDANINEQVIKLASNIPVIISEHDFDKTPVNDELQAIVDKANELGGSIVKIATMARSREDVTRLLKFTEECSSNMVSIAMGEIGTISRVLAPLFGSLFTYAFITDIVAPGQISLEKMVEELKFHFPHH